MGRIIDYPTLTDVGEDDYVLVESTLHGTAKAPIGVQLAGVYDGKNLEEIFADEIANFDNVWKWIQNRCYERNYSGLRPKDYIKFTLNGQTVVAQIAGLEPYLGATDQELAGHIDFISKECYPEYVQWNTSNNTQGNATNAAPYMVCNLKAWYDEMADALPTELYNVILNKRSYMETRYTSGSTLTSSTGGAWNDLGKLWAPHEIEVHGALVFGGQRAGYNPVHYDIFRDGRSLVKHFGEGGENCRWWEADVMEGSSANACAVTLSGLAYTNATSNTTIAPVLGFRIGYEA